MASKSAAADNKGGVAPAQVAKAWAKGKLPRAALVVGAESALREQALAGVREAAFAGADPGMGWVVLHADAGEEAQDLLPASVLDEIRTRPMFADPDAPKVVVIRHADEYLNKADVRDVFERNLEAIPGDATLVFEVAQAGRLKSTRLYKALQKENAVVECDPLSHFGGPDSPLSAEVERRARALGLKMNLAAVKALIDRSGQHLGVLEEELSKLSLSLGAQEDQAVAVTEADVARICADARLVGAFEFADAVAERNRKAALEALGAIFAHGLGDHKKPGRVVTNEANIAMRLLGALTYKLTQLQDAQAGLDKGLREDAAFREAKAFTGFQQQGVRRALRMHNAKSLRACMEALMNANLALRTGAGRREALERLVWDVCRR